MNGKFLILKFDLLLPSLHPSLKFCLQKEKKEHQCARHCGIHVHSKFISNVDWKWKNKLTFTFKSSMSRDLGTVV